MPNVIVELHQEVARVEQLIPKLPEAGATHARAVIRDARTAMSLNNYEAMREAIDDLKAIVVVKK
jgi:hypothetical protein